MRLDRLLEAITTADAPGHMASDYRGLADGKDYTGWDLDGRPVARGSEACFELSHLEQRHPCLFERSVSVNVVIERAARDAAKFGANGRDAA